MQAHRGRLIGRHGRSPLAIDSEVHSFQPLSGLLVKNDPVREHFLAMTKEALVDLVMEYLQDAFLNEIENQYAGGDQAKKMLEETKKAVDKLFKALDCSVNQMSLRKS